MKRSLTTLVLIALIFTSCIKQGIPEPGDADYDLHHNIFRIQVASTNNYSLDIAEYNTDNATPYNSQHAEQTGPFDYGFTPGIGHKISVNIKSEKGVITSIILYKGTVLNPVVVKSVGEGSTAGFEYVVEN